MKTCKEGHDWEDNKTNRGDECRLCKNRKARKRLDKIRGGPPKEINLDFFPCGHSRKENIRSGRGDCAECHRNSAKERYWSDPNKYRNESNEYQKRNREGARLRSRRFRLSHPRYDAARHTPLDQETLEWLEIISLDPCTHCGAEMEAIDHILAASKDGPNHWTNFAPICKSCNSSKGNKNLLAWMLQRSA